MNEHIQNLLLQRQYSEDVKDEAILWVLFNGESAIDVAEAVDSTASATINLWAIAYHRKIEDGLITLVPMKGCSFNSYLIILTTISCIKSKQQKQRNPLKTSTRSLHISPAYTKQPVNEHFAL